MNKMTEKQKRIAGEFYKEGGRDGFLKEVAKAKSIREKVSKIPETIQIPVYYHEDECGRAVIEKDGTLVYDFEEMASELANRIYKVLGKNVSLAIIQNTGKNKGVINEA